MNDGNSKLLTRAVSSDEDAILLHEYMCESGSAQKELLWQILFEMDFSDSMEIEDRIYEFGSGLKDKDIFGRVIFMRLVTLLDKFREARIA